MKCRNLQKEVEKKLLQTIWLVFPRNWYVSAKKKTIETKRDVNQIFLWFVDIRSLILLRLPAFYLASGPANIFKSGGALCFLKLQSKTYLLVGTNRYGGLYLLANWNKVKISAKTPLSWFLPGLGLCKYSGVPNKRIGPNKRKIGNILRYQ